MLIISLSLMLGFVYPRFIEYSTAKQENMTKSRDLDDVSKNINAVKSLADDLAKNSKNAEIVKSYFPQTPREENILNTINYLASSAGVLLSNVTLEKDVSAKSLVVGAAEGKVAENATSGSTKTPLDIKFITVGISVVGEYDKIQMFADSLQRSHMYGTISEYLIKKDDQPAAADAQNKSQNDTMLLGKITFKAGYSAPLKSGKYTDVDFSAPSVDFSALNAIESASSPAAPAMGIVSTGRRNPFLP